MPIKYLRGPQIQVTSMNYFFLGRVGGNNFKIKHGTFRATRWSDIRFQASDHFYGLDRAVGLHITPDFSFTNTK